MKSYCETITKSIIPAIRALVAIQLTQKYNMTQLKIAKKLRVTQPAISYYLRSKRGKSAIEKLKNDNQIMELTEQLADLIYHGESEVELQRIICDICIRIRNKKLL